MYEYSILYSAHWVRRKIRHCRAEHLAYDLYSSSTEPWQARFLGVDSDYFWCSVINLTLFVNPNLPSPFSGTPIGLLWSRQPVLLTLYCPHLFPALPLAGSVSGRLLQISLAERKFLHICEFPAERQSEVNIPETNIQKYYFKYFATKSTHQGWTST